MTGTGMNGAGWPGGRGPADGGREPACALPRELVAAYAGGRLDGAQAWSVEAHLPDCPDCRAALAGYADAAPAAPAGPSHAGLDRGRLDRNRAVLLARLGLPGPGPVRRALRRCGVSDDTVTLLTATPSLRRSWLAGILLVLAVALGSAWIAPAAGPDRTALGHDLLAWNLVPFFVLAPLLPLAAVATVFSAVLDPAYRLAVAAPVPKVRLLLVRSVAVVGATLVPTVLAGLALPGPWWLPAATLLPTLAMCSVALAAGTVAGPVPGAIAACFGWVAAVVAAGMAADNPALIFGPRGQLAALAVLAVAGTLVTARRSHIDHAWMR